MGKKCWQHPEIFGSRTSAADGGTSCIRYTLVFDIVSTEKIDQDQEAISEVLVVLTDVQHRTIDRV